MIVEKSITTHGKNVLDRLRKVGTYLFVFLIPLQTRYIISPGSLNMGYWEYGTFSVYGVDLLIFLLWFFAFFEKGFVARSSLYKKNCVTSKAFTRGILLGLLVFGITFFAAFDPLLSLFGIYQAFLAGLLLFLLTRPNISPRVVCWIFLISMLLQAFLIFHQSGAQHVFASKWLGMSSQNPVTPGVSVVETLDARWLRGYGSLPHPNIVGGYLMVALLVAMVFYQSLYREQKLKSVLLLLAMSLFLFFALYLTFSRSALLGLLVVFFGLVVYAWRKKNRVLQFTLFKFAFVGIVSFLVFATLFSKELSVRVSPSVYRFTSDQTLQRLEQKSLSDRRIYFEEAIEIIRTNSLFGVGFRNYTIAAHELVDNSRESYEYQPIHNIYILFLVEFGILGFLVFILLFFSFMSCTSAWKSSVLFLFLTPLFVVGFFDHYLATLPSGLFLSAIVIFFGHAFGKDFEII